MGCSGSSEEPIKVVEINDTIINNENRERTKYEEEKKQNLKGKKSYEILYKKQSKINIPYENEDNIINTDKKQEYNDYKNSITYKENIKIENFEKKINDNTKKLKSIKKKNLNNDDELDFNEKKNMPKLKTSYNNIDDNDYNRENGNNDFEEEENFKKKKWKSRKKINKEEEEDEYSNKRIKKRNKTISKKKGVKKKKKQIDEEEEENEENKENEEEEEEEEDEEEEDIEVKKIMLKSNKKKINNVIINIEIKKDPLWKDAKRFLFLKYKESIEDSKVNDIDIAITSIITITKNDFSKYNLSQKFLIHQIKNSNQVNWARKPYNGLRKNLLKIITSNELLEKYINFDFNNNSINEYEPFTSEIKMIKLSLKEEKQNIEHFLFSIDQIKDNIIILIFDFNDNDSMILFKEIINYQKENNINFTFFPIYGPILDSPMNSTFVWDLALKNGLDDNNLEIYILGKDDLNKRFNYITNDNERKIICKVIVIDKNKIVRDILTPKDFTFNLVTQIDKINKNDYEKYKKNICQFVSEENSSLQELQKYPIKCNLFLKKTKIYSYDKSDGTIINSKTFYETLSGEIKANDNFEYLYKELEENFIYIKRENPKHFKISYNKKTDMISKLLGQLFKEKKLKDINYISKFETNSLYMRINPNNDYEQKFDILKNKDFKVETFLSYKNFLDRHHYSISQGQSELMQFPFAKNLDYLSCIIKLGEYFPKEISLYDSQTKGQINVKINEDNNNPSLIIVFSLSSKDYFAKMEMIYRLNQIYKKINGIKNSLNIYLIYRGELYPFEREFNEIRDEEIFNQNFPLFICSSNCLFPLYYQNNGIESADSQLKVFLLDNENKIKYHGICDDINLKASIINISDGEDIKYLKHYPISNDDYTSEIKPIVDDIENILEKILKNNLLYRPYVSFSHCKCDSYINNQCNNEPFINNLRLKILIKEKHKNLILKNPEFKEKIKKLKEYGITILIVPLPCEEIDINYECYICKKEIEKNSPFYYDQEEENAYCLKCEKKSGNQVYLTYFKSEYYEDEIISELYNSNSRYNSLIDPFLGETCKICNQTLQNEYYLNLTHINHLSKISPMLPIDICENCFNIINNGGHFNNIKLMGNYNKFGLSSKHMIYRRIKYQAQNNINIGQLQFQFDTMNIGF